ncbi:MAG: SIS domain-containing protein [Azospirillaceae bacterium]
MTASRMLAEARQAPERLAASLAAEDAAYRDAGARIRAAAPHTLVTVARGTSDNAAEFLGRLAAERTGLIPASLPPSLVTVENAPLGFEGCLVVAISQSGGSPDLIAPVEAARAGGALTVALVNAPDSPLGRAAEIVLPVGAGEETAVAATKSFVLSLAQAVRLVAAMAGDDALRARLDALPATLEAALALDWSAAVDALAGTGWMPVCGRGLGAAGARELALKLKETTGVAAEGFTAAEVMHGPRTLIGETTPVLCLAPDDAARPSMESAMAELGTMTGRLIAVGRPAPGVDLALPLPDLADPVHGVPAAMAAAYPFLDALAARNGVSPDTPRHLEKVTRTL